MRGMRGVVIALAATACSYHPTPNGVGGDGSLDGPSDGPSPDVKLDGPLDATPDNARKKLITIDPDRVDNNQTDFPVWIILDTDADLAARALTDGSDIFFTQPDGTPLEHQIQRWDKGTGHLEAWVKSDLDDGNPTVIEMHYGDPGMTHAANPAMVFSNAFLAVWHFEEDPAVTATIADARGAVPGTVVSNPTSVNAQLGRGISFDGNNDEITFTNPYAGNTSHTISFWADVQAPGSGFSSVLTLGNNSTDHSRFLHTDYTAGIGYGFFGNDAQTQNNIDGGGRKFVVWVFDSGTRTSTLYINGQLKDTHVHNAIDTQGTGGHIATAPNAWGPGGNTPSPLKGVLDELRLANTIRLAGWITTEFANQNSPGTFYSVGAETTID